MGVAQELSGFHVTVAENRDRFGTFALVPTKELSLVSRQVIYVHGQQETVAGIHVVRIVADNVTVCVAIVVAKKYTVK